MNRPIAIPTGNRIEVASCDAVTVGRFVLSLPQVGEKFVLSLPDCPIGSCFHSRDRGLTHRNDWGIREVKDNDLNLNALKDCG